jgi:hypothetical protein
LCFKRARNKTDLCEYCEIGLSLKSKISSFLKRIRPDLYQDKFDTDKFLSAFGQNELQLTDLDYPNDNDEENSDDETSPLFEENNLNTLYDAGTNLNNIVEQLKLIKQIEFHQFIAAR